MFGKIIIYDAQWQVTLNLKQWSGINSNTQRYYDSSGYLRVLIRSELKLQKKPGETIFFRCSKVLNQLWDLTEIQTHPCFYVCPSYLQE